MMFRSRVTALAVAVTIWRLQLQKLSAASETVQITLYQLQIRKCCSKNERLICRCKVYFTAAILSSVSVAASTKRKKKYRLSKVQV